MTSALNGSSRNISAYHSPACWTHYSLPTNPNQSTDDTITLFLTVLFPSWTGRQETVHTYYLWIVVWPLTSLLLPCSPQSKANVYKMSINLELGIYIYIILHFVFIPHVHITCLLYVTLIYPSIVYIESLLFAGELRPVLVFGYTSWTGHH